MSLETRGKRGQRVYGKNASLHGAPGGTLLGFVSLVGPWITKTMAENTKEAEEFFSSIKDHSCVLGPDGRLSLWAKDSLYVRITW